METLVVAGFAHGERTNDGTKSVVGDQRHVESKEPKDNAMPFGRELSMPHGRICALRDMKRRKSG